ncbi:hypothetical protein [Terrarubrum flagellatum]|uniref:hypothetical protein n=1 Tax=Terrirubrum flagellatum TaxID=2895980 RepID=UPI0031452ED5
MDIALRAAPAGARPALPSLVGVIASLFADRPARRAARPLDANNDRQLRDLGLQSGAYDRPDWKSVPSNWLGPIW